MKTTGRLWRALEAAPVLAGVRASWSRVAGSDLSALAPLLRPRGDSATTYPSVEPDAGECAREVVVHGPSDIVAVCRCDRSCAPIALTKADIVVYELDSAKLAVEVRQLLGVAGDSVPARVDGLFRTLYLGTHQSLAGLRFPVYLTLQHETEELTAVIERLSARDARPFILVAPTADLIGPRAAEMMRARGAYVVSLADVAGVDERGKLVALVPAHKILENVRTDVLETAVRAETRGGMAFFPTPAGATWGELEIRFRDGHTVSVRFGEERGVFSYGQMGMANKKNAEPTVQWTLLRTFARGHGLLTWQSPDATRQNQKRRETLAKDLRRFFRIDEDPIALTEDGKGWRVRFSLHPEG